MKYSVRLAPMCGVTDFIYRSICFEMGCDTAYTEMISAMGYLCAPRQRTNQQLMQRGPDEKKLILQLFGKDPAVVAEAAGRIAATGVYDGIDLNMGCPAHKIAPSGEGCGLMRTPETAYQMMKRTVEAVSLPVSVKMRLGWDADHINVEEMALAAQEAGIQEITVHGRTRQQQYSGEADWEWIKRVRQIVSIPVIGNGDLFTAEHAVEKQAAAGTAGIMIGRGAMGNPWIFREIRALQDNTDLPTVTLEERYNMIVRHYDMMISAKPEPLAVREMRKHAAWYIHGMRGSASVRAAINHCATRDDVIKVVDAFFMNQKD